SHVRGVEVRWTAAMAIGSACFIRDGAVRDVPSLEPSGFPISCRAVSMRAATKARRGIVRMPVTCGGQLVRPGDVVAADETGVVVLPAAGLPEVLEKARARQEREAKLMADVRGGKTTLELLALTPLLDDVKQK